MAYSADMHLELRRLYVHKRLQLPAAAIKLGIATATAQNWKNKAKADGDDWDKRRAAYSLSEEGIEETALEMFADFTIQFNATMDMLRDGEVREPEKRVKLLATMTDAMSKMTSTMARLAPDVNLLANDLTVLKAIMDYLEEHDRSVFAAMVAHVEPIGERLRKRHA